MENRPFVRLPQGGHKMFTDGQKPTFEPQDNNDAEIILIIFFAIIIVIGIVLNLIQPS